MRFFDALFGNKNQILTVTSILRWSTGQGRAIEHIELVQHRGILYITNRRIVFQAKEWGKESWRQALNVWI